MSFDTSTPSIAMLYRRVRAFLGRPILMHHKSVVTIDEAQYCENPIFVMGCHRSGTTLLRRILNSHSSIACPPESNFLVHFIEFLNDDVSMDGLAGMMDLRRAREEVVRQAFRFHEAFRIANGKPRWADKSPRYVSHYNEIRRMAPANTQFVVIVRDPRDIACSIISRGWIIEEIDRDLTTNTCLYVRKTMQRLIAISAQPNVHTLGYEDLASNPEPVTRALCDFLGEPWEEALQRPWDFDHNFGTEDPIARARKKFEPSIGNWKSLKANERDKIASLLEDVCIELGYQAA
jgi:hypothetical protein